MAHITGPPAKRSLGGKATLLPPLYPRPAGAPPAQEPSGSLMDDLGLSLEIGVTQMEGVSAWLQGAGASLLEKAGFEDAARSQRISARQTVRDMYESIRELEALYTGPQMKPSHGEWRDACTAWRWICHRIGPFSRSTFFW